MVKLGSGVIGVHKGKKFEGKLVARMHPLPGVDADVLYRVELPNGKRIEVAAHQFIGIGGLDSEGQNKTVTLGGETFEVETLKNLLAYHAKRCPHCEDSNFSSDLNGNHECYSCDKTFTDETALPSLAAVEKGAEDAEETE